MSYLTKMLLLIESISTITSFPRATSYGTSKAVVRAIGQVMSTELHVSGVSCTPDHEFSPANFLAKV
ncbi:hypothetical protein [Salegentibacter sp. F14]